MTTDLERLDDGEYMALLYRDGQPVSDRVYLKIDRKTGVIEITADTPSSTGPTYDLNGRVVSQPLRPGIYIVNGRKVAL